MIDNNNSKSVLPKNYKKMFFSPIRILGIIAVLVVIGWASVGSGNLTALGDGLLIVVGMYWTIDVLSYFDNRKDLKYEYPTYLEWFTGKSQ